MPQRTTMTYALTEPLKTENNIATLILEDALIKRPDANAIKLFGFENESAIENIHPSRLSPEYQPDGKLSSIKANEMIDIAMTEGYQRFLWVHSKLDGTPFYALVTLKKQSVNCQTCLDVEIEALALQDYIFQQLCYQFFQNSTDAIMVSDTNNIIQLVNKEFCTVSGYTKQEVIGQQTGFMKSGRHGPEFYRKMWDQLNQVGYWEGEIWDKKKCGSIYPKTLKINRINDFNGNAQLYVGLFKDTSEQTTYQANLKKLAYYDTLTNLPNRQLLMERLQQHILDSDVNQSHFALLIVDIDQFKQINDFYGHQTGDELLQLLAKRINSLPHYYKIRGRLAADEFLLTAELSENTSLETISNELKAELGAYAEINGQFIQFTCSIGASVYPVQARTEHELLKFADISLYKAKDTHGFSLQPFKHEYWESAVHLITTSREIEIGLKRNEFVPYYQPKFDPKTSEVVGFEALARWQHNAKGLLSPIDFLEAAQKTKLDCQISFQILTKVCDFIARSALPSNLSVSVNFSPEQIVQPGFIDAVNELINQADINPNQIELEVTESSIVTNSKMASDSLKLIRQQGIKVSLDDFGTGYSSLGHLKNLPIDILKIDKLFIDELCEKQTADKALVTSITQMAKALNLKVVAEGVENWQQLDVLNELGCDMVQGYLFSHPVTELEVIKILEHSPIKDLVRQDNSSKSNFAVSNFHSLKNLLINSKGIFDNSFDAIIITSADANNPKIIYTNPAFSKMSGYSAKELIGQSPKILQGPKTNSATLERLNRELSLGLNFHGSFINYRKDGTEYHVECKIHKVKDRLGNDLCYISSQRDFSSFKNFINKTLKDPAQIKCVISTLINKRSSIKTSKTLQNSYVASTQVDKDVALLESASFDSFDLFDIDDQLNVEAHSAEKITAEQFHQLIDISFDEATHLGDILQECLLHIELARVESQKGQALKEFLMELQEFANGIFYMDEFMDLCSALSSLVNVLTTQALTDLEPFFVEILHAMTNDLIMWLENIFINKASLDIHEFDASIIGSTKQIIMMLE